MDDVCKLLHIERALARPARKILLFCDAVAANSFQNASWRAAALANSFGIEIHVVEISGYRRRKLRRAQKLQYR
jgi:hypothetical protein